MKCEFCHTADVRLTVTGEPSRFCSRKCASKYSCEVRKATNLEKYGATTPMRSKDVLAKRDATNIERYGVASVFNDLAIRNKGKATCLERYGSEHACQSPIIQEKIKAVWSKYDGGHPWADPVVRQNREDTLLERFGVKHPILCPEIKDKIELTVLERFGFTNAAKSESVRAKISTTNSTPELKAKRENNSMIRYGVKFPNQRSIKDQLEFLENEQWLAENVAQLGLVGVAVLLDVSIDTIRKYTTQFGISAPSKSAFELQVSAFISSIYTGEMLLNKRIANNKEIDIYLPELKLGIECNGSYWHSELNGRGRSYHLNKTEALAEIGIHLLHVWEHDWLFNRAIIESRIKSFLHRNNVIYARKCEIRPVTVIESSKFLIDNHIQGNCQSSIRLGLYYVDKLVSLMTFGKSRFASKVEYELIRYVNLTGHTVVGGASKLFAAFVKQYAPKSVISYSDKSFNKGTLYSTLGFDLTHTSPPAYYYTRNYKQFESRVKFQKHKLSKLLENFDPELSEWDNMKLNGYDRIWDCGNDVWLYNSTN